MIPIGSALLDLTSFSANAAECEYKLDSQLGNGFVARVIVKKVNVFKDKSWMWIQL